MNIARKCIIYTTLILTALFANNLYGQAPTGNLWGKVDFYPVPPLSFGTGRDFRPVSPSVASLGIFGKIPVGNFTGTAQINIPIYEINYKELSVPISINYHASANKPDILPGPIGHAWSIQAGGSISRASGNGGSTGIPTPTITPSVQYILPDPRSGDQWFKLSWVDSFLNNMYVEFENQTIDSNMPDPEEFNFNINGHTGKFYLNPKDTFQIQSTDGESFLIIKHDRIDNTFTFPAQAYSPPNLPDIDIYDIRIPAQRDARDKIVREVSDYYMSNPYYNDPDYNNKIRIDHVIGGFTMIDNNGIKYIFGAVDGSNKSDSSIEFSRSGFNEYHMPIGKTRSTNESAHHFISPTSWLLTSILSPNGYSISFIYLQETYVTKNRFTDVALSSTNTYDGNSTTASQAAHTEDGTVVNFINGCYLKEIISPTEKVTFFNSFAKDQLDYSKDLASYNEPRNFGRFYAYSDIGFANTERLVGPYDTNEAIVLSRFWPHKIDTISIMDNNQKILRKVQFNYSKSTSERLTLNSLNIKDQKNSIQTYNFDYNSTHLPGYLSNETDHYGFYNGNQLFSAADLSGYVAKIDILCTFYDSYNRDYLQEKKQPDGRFSQAGILERITYPTGGYTTFKYEPHEYSKFVETWPFNIRENTVNTITGGVRIKTIQNYDPNNVLLSEKHYHYVNDYMSGGIKSSGVLAYTPKYTESASNKDIIYNGKKEGHIAYFRRFSTNPISTVMTSKGNHITYSEVAEEEINNGVTIYRYKNHDNGYLDKEPLGYISNATVSGSDHSTIEKHWESDDGISMDIERGQVLSEQFFDNEHNMKKKIVYRYNDDNNRFNDNVRYIRVSTNYPRFAGYRSQRMTAGVHYTYYPYLKEKEIIDYIDTDSIFQKESYTYDTRYRLIKSKKTVTSLGQEILSETNYTVDQDLTDPICKKMFEKRMLAYPFETKSILTNNKTVKNVFKYRDDLSIGDSLLILHYQNLKQINNNPEYIESTIYKYDQFANPINMEERINGKVCFIWSYYGQYPIAEIKNATYEEVKTALGVDDNYINALSNQISLTPSDSIKINSLRILLPNALISTYTYRPLVGMLTATDPRGVTTYYDYDGFSRLIRTYIKENGVEKTIQRNDYHYQNQ